MIRRALLAAAVALAAPAAAQQTGCAMSGCPRVIVLSDADRARIEAAVRAVTDEVIAVTEPIPGLTVTAKDWVQNARAHLRSGRPEIAYNPLWVREWLDHPEGERWPLIGIVAHEIAHHTLGHVGSLRADPDRHLKELQADAVAGYVLYRMGATKEQALSLWRALPERATRTHPGSALRRTAAAAGWTGAAEGLGMDHGIAAVAYLRR